MGSYGLTWAVKNSDKVLKVVILNTPLSVSSQLPGLFQKLRLDPIISFAASESSLESNYVFFIDNLM